jgi:plastocyanin
MRFSIVSLMIGAAALGLVTSTPADAQARWRPYRAAYYAPDTYFYSPSGTMVYYPYTYTYVPSTSYYFAPSYSLPSTSYGGGFYPPASSYTSYLPATAYSDYSATLYSSNPAQTATVDMHDNYFAPKTLTIRPGTTVRWVNYGTRHHTTTSTDGLWDSGDLGPGDAYTATFHRQGTYAYYCRFHSEEMRATVVVQ